MSEMRKSVIQYKSNNGVDTVTGYFYENEGTTPCAVLQISHGMCEYIARYDDFAAFMVKNGFAVCGNDHLGHGATSDTEVGTDGYFAPKDGYRYVLQDLKTMNDMATQRYPNVPIILMGHSMGSFFARLYATEYPQSIAALIISGTGGPNPLGSVGIFLTKLLKRMKGEKYRSDFINNLAFGAYCKRIESPRSPHAWLTHDDEIIDVYDKDPKCTFVFTVSGFNDMMRLLQMVNTSEWAQRIPKELPILIFSGDMDPVGDYGKGVQKVYDLLHTAGVKDVTLKLYKDGRHEMLNETNRAEVYTDVLAWCERYAAQNTTL